MQSVTGVPAATIRDRRAPTGRRRRRVHPHRPRRRTARRRHRHRDRRHQPRPAPRPARTPRLRLRHAHRAGQRPGRPRARPEVRPAARATARSPTPPPAPTSPRVWGVDPDVIPGPGVPAVELLQSLGARRRAAACSCTAPTSWSRRRTRRAVREGLERLDLLVVCDFFLSETAALADVVLPVTQWAEEEGTMTNLEGRVIRRRRALDSPGRRAQRALDHRASWPTPGCAGDLRRSTPETVFDELRSRLRGRPRRLLRDRLRDAGPRRGRLLAVPGRLRRHAAAVPGPLRPPRRTGPDRRGRPARRTTAACAGDGRADPDHRAAAGALPVRRADAAGGRARRGPARSARRPCTRPPPSGSASPTATPSNCPTSAGSVHCRALLTGDIRPDDVFLPFHFAGDGSANLLTRRGRPDLGDAGVQDQRRARRAGVEEAERRMTGSPHSAMRRRSATDRSAHASSRTCCPPCARATSSSPWSARSRARPTTACWSPSTPSARRSATSLTIADRGRRRSRRRPHRHWASASASSIAPHGSPF